MHPLFGTMAALLPLVQVAPVTPADLRPIAAQIDTRPHGTVRLQCRIHAGTRSTDLCVAVAGDEVLDDAAFDERRRDARPPFGSLADVAIRLTEQRQASVAPASENRMVAVERMVDFSDIPLTPPAPPPPLNPRTATILPGPGFADPARSYPPMALRASAEGRVQATCRVRPDHRLACFRARIDRSGGYGLSSPTIDDALVGATFRLIEEASIAPTANDGTPTAGRDVDLAFRWLLPE